MRKSRRKAGFLRLCDCFLFLPCGEILPYRRVQQDEQREKFQSAGQHVEHQHIFGKMAEEIEVGCRAYLGKAGTDVVDGSRNRGKVGNLVMAFQ